jgi:hypothetical protein
MGTVALGDKIRVQRVGTTVKYYFKDVLVYTSLIPSTNNLSVQSLFYTLGGKFDNLGLYYGEKKTKPGQAIVFCYYTDFEGKPVEGAIIDFEFIPNQAQYLKTTEYMVSPKKISMTTDDVGYASTKLICSDEFQGGPLQYKVTVTRPDGSVIKFLNATTKTPIKIDVPIGSTVNLTELITGIAV